MPKTLQELIDEVVAKHRTFTIEYHPHRQEPWEATISELYWGTGFSARQAMAYALADLREDIDYEEVAPAEAKTTSITT